MGVTGLWGIVDSVGHPVNLETLHNKVIAIDLSLWVNQSIKGFRGRNGQTVDNAHVLGLFHRVCKLLFYKIKPVFVFDGTTPQLKRNTIAKRAERRLKAVDKSRESALKVLTKYLSSQLPPSSAKQIPRSDSLPSLESSLHPIPDNHDFKVYEELNELERDKELSDSDHEDSDSESDPIIAHTYRNIQNLDSIDINSDDFKALPLDVRYEILTELKQKYKGYRNTELMPKESNDFSKYQMLRLLKKRSLQSKIEETISQLNGQNSEDIIANFAKNDFVFESDSTAGRLMSDETTRFIFLKKSQTSSSKITDEDNHINSNTTKTHLIVKNLL
ncbi:unnamed protein product [Oppiella nova]|uniref:XPG N-terminal domain-containing protein n=1 Tax=Oppiella nova TaxID=334625 RepID=A0A7R9QAQ3_9ACAR|nr:unnamed protein product [Oppiella nova]CAG2161861.1 unnamed protein product [Oppiella nova]